MKAIDLFAGLGGNSEGAKQAGVPVVWAANHWESAVQIHAANHPGTGHACQDLHQADWTQVPAHAPLPARDTRTPEGRSAPITTPGLPPLSVWYLRVTAETEKPKSSRSTAGY
ncbi:hypothetical protein PT7_1525 [Pusillimonas sp. T7-7]|uniref:DNA cytosine methyltransferase n=1 Tax=Pusillimonas sp. (strain T7-7) TaxID=1007105 RepID=UPI0002084F01|nr:DNA cytosine methyltransferase [Pusillimonas sp. T7-7]AEC20065.1 hypothetical protein PT7_1525 [Pusillimonas sp. T7-7]